eukprot:Amastigsp_a1459_27.p3 type:complete len:222 gc:universal Amastigsp_a1459_27:1138-473(-)
MCRCGSGSTRRPLRARPTRRSSTRTISTSATTATSSLKSMRCTSPSESSTCKAAAQTWRTRSSSSASSEAGRMRISCACSTATALRARRRSPRQRSPCCSRTSSTSSRATGLRWTMSASPPPWRMRLCAQTERWSSGPCAAAPRLLQCIAWGTRCTAQTRATHAPSWGDVTATRSGSRKTTSPQTLSRSAASSFMADSCDTTESMASSASRALSATRTTPW